MRRGLVAGLGAPLCACLAVLSLSTPAGAHEIYGSEVAGLCGTVTMGNLPPSLRAGADVKDSVQIFPEYTGRPVLTTAVPVDVQSDGTYDRPSDLPSPQPTIPPGPPDDDGFFRSWLLHWDPPSDLSTARRTVTVGFNGQIAGIQILSGTVDAAASHQFHVAGVTYPVSADGLHLAADGSGDRVHVFDNEMSVSISLIGHATLTDVRVITYETLGTPQNPGGISPGPLGTGYRMVGGDGGVFLFGPDHWAGSLGATHLNQPIVGGERMCGLWYWLVARDGGVFAFDAPFLGSTGGAPPGAPVVGMSATASGGGYYLATATGEVMAFGDAQFHGDTSALHLHEPIVGIAATPTGDGYWLVASDGGVFAFGDARFDGSTGAIHLNKPIVGMRAALDGNGYYLFASDGGVFTFSSNAPGTTPVPFYGSAGATGDPNAFVGMRLTVDGDGYWLADSTGRVYGYGPSAPSTPGVSGIHLASPIVNMF